MQYRASKKFVRIEALGAYGQNGRVSDPADPLELEVRVTDANDVEHVIENGSIGGSRVNKPYRLATGLWGFNPPPGFYEEGKTYTINWRYMMTPGNLKVDRTNFVWNSTPTIPREDTHCVVSGSLLGIEGTPKSDVLITIEQYKDYVTLNHRLGTFEVVTDAFGNWFAELERNAIYRVLVGQYAKTVKIPALNAVALKDIPDYQAADVRKDNYGYPLP